MPLTELTHQYGQQFLTSQNVTHHQNQDVCHYVDRVLSRIQISSRVHESMLHVLDLLQELLVQIICQIKSLQSTPTAKSLAQ